ncbi:MAG: hypothetical protein HKO59_15305 [Phycisphaerales bacterium]|nr:hypothetical protein [Phycisphaerae bacterium]NNF42244.1 hypothetical protein [Phycisphaerales bacterium]NNM27327.1 hypothetical protein [Phycisphaerales bacterium]
MRRAEKPARPSGLALTATTLVALVSVVAALPAAPTRVAGVGSVRTLEASTMRAVAAAMAVAACDRLRAPAPTPAAIPAFEMPRLPRETLVAEIPPPGVVLGEHRLDLPPPLA